MAIVPFRCGGWRARLPGVSSVRAFLLLGRGGWREAVRSVCGVYSRHKKRACVLRGCPAVVIVCAITEERVCVCMMPLAPQTAQF